MTAKKAILSAAIGALAVLLVLGAIGCGGGDDSTRESTEVSTAAAPLSKAVFIKRANALCVKGDQRQHANYKDFVEKNGKERNKEKEEEIVLEVGLPAIEVELEELRELGAPKGDEAEIAAMLDLVEKAIEETKEDPLSVYTNNPFSPSEGKAAVYGLKKCGFT